LLVARCSLLVARCSLHSFAAYNLRLSDGCH
jgi:hypothetical protein